MKDQMQGAGASGRPELSRRNFLKMSTLAPLVGVPALDDARSPVRPAGRRDAAGTAEGAVRVALIGYGVWGREIAATLARLPQAELAAVCDTYDVMLKRAERDLPAVARHPDYRAVLDDPSVTSVVVATPTHRHRDVAVAALEAGKHVYLEAPMASTVEDARAIAQAAQARKRQIFQVGLLYRCDPQYNNVFRFVRSGAIGTPVMMRSQWHAKESWRRASSNQEREREANWRLDASISTGLMGEIGIHQIDPAVWLLQALPVAVTGFGQTILWKDGRAVPDTVQAIFEFPGDVHLLYDATLASSFDGQYDLLFGSDSTIMLRDGKGWMFKEVDAPVLGWEVYARRDTFYREKGIALVANATKLAAQGLDPAAVDPDAETPLFYGLKEFVDNHLIGPFPATVGYKQGFESVVIAVKANEAVLGKKRIEFDPAWFEIG